MTDGSRRRHGERGFTLVEVLVVVVILAVIGFALTEAVVLGLRTTDGTAASSSRSSASQALASYFTDDAQSAESVSTDQACAQQPVLVNLAWLDQGVARAVAYGLEPAVGDEQDLVRWSCSGGDAATKRILGRYTRDKAVGPGAPVTVECGAGCPSASPASPDTITLRIKAAQILPAVTPEPDHALTLTVRRRTAE